MKINALTVAIMGKASRSELHQLDVETLMRVALFVRTQLQFLPMNITDLWITAQSLSRLPRRRLLG